MSTFNLSMRLSQDAAHRAAKSFNATVLAIGKNVDALNAKLKGMGASKPVRNTSIKPLGVDAAEAAKKLDLLARKEELVTTIAKRHGIAVTSARKAVGAYKNDLSAAARSAGTYATRLDRATKEQRELTRAQRAGSKSTSIWSKAIKSVTLSIGGLVLAGLSITALFGAANRVIDFSYDSFTRLESAVVSVRKVVNDLSADAFSDLIFDLEDLSTSSIPIATEKLEEYGAVAAQIGIQSAEGIKLAATTGAQLAEATDLSGEAAIKSLSRILAIQGESVDSLDNLGSALVELGNTSRATEAEIEPIANEIARATANYDIASPTILGYAAALAEMGAKAEGSGTALAELFQTLLVAGKTGEGLEELAKIADVSADSLRELIDQDVGEAAIVFLQGLRRYGKEGVLALDEVGLSSKRVAKALLPLAANSDRLVDRIALSNKAFQENTALSREAEAAFGKLKSDAQRLENALRLVASDGFGALAPAISTFLKEAVASIVVWRRFKKELEGIPAVAVPAAVAIELLNKRIERDMVLLRALPLMLSALATTGLEPLADALEIMAAAPGGFGLQILADQVRGLQIALLKAGAAAVVPKEKLEETGGVADEVAEILKALGIELDDDTASLTKMAGALKSVYDELKTLDAAKRFVKDFGLSLSEAGDAAKLKLSEGVKLADAQVAALVKRLSASKKELAALALVASLGPGNLAKIPVAADTGVAAPQGEPFAAFKRIVALTSEYATEEERAAAAIKEAQELLGGNAEYADLLKRIIEANRVEVETTNDELAKQEFLWEKIRNAAFDAAKDSSGAWQKFLLGVSDNVDGILNGVAMLGQVLTESGHAGAGGLLSGFEQIASGNVGAGIGTIAGGFGLTEGNFLAEGAMIGEQFGGVWGSVIGAAIGSFVKKGKDDLHSALRDVGGRADLVITQAEGELAEAAQQAEAVLEGFFNTLQEGLVAELDFAAAGLEFHGRGGDRWRVVVNGIEQIFDTMEEALAFATQGVLAANAQTAGLGENMRALFENLSGPAVAGSLEELQAAIAKAQELDFAETGVTGDLIRSRERALSIGRQYGLSLEAIIALEDKRIAAQRRAIEAQAASVYGVEDVVGRFEDLTGNLTRFDAELAADHDARAARLEEIRAQLADTAAAGDDAVAAASGAAGGLLGLRDGSNRAGEGVRQLSGDLGDARGDFLDGAQGLLAARDATRALEDEMAALEASLESGAEAFGADKVGQLWTTAVDQVAASLAQMIDAVQGGTAHAADLEAIRQRQFAFTLVAQIEQARLLLATMEGVSDAVRGMLERLVAEGQGILEGLASGDLTLPPAGGGAKKGGGGNRQQRMQAVDDFRAAAADLRAELEASSPAALQHSRALQELREKGEEAKMGAEELGAALADLAELQLLELAESWREASETFGQIDLKKKIDDLKAQAEADLATAAESAAANPEAYAAAEREIREGLSASLRQAGQDALDAIGNPMRDLRQRSRETIRSIRYMLNHLEELGLTAEQVANQVRAAALPDLLDILEKQARRVGDEEALAAIQQRRSQWELAYEKLKFELLVKELEIAGAITPAIQELIDMGHELFDLADGARGAIEEIDEDSLTAPIVSSSRRISSASDAAAASFDNLAESIRAFVSGFEQTAVGRFEAQARDWLDAVASFERQIAEALSQDLGGLTGEQRLQSITGSLFGTTDLGALSTGQLAELKTFVDALAASGNVFGAQLQELVDILQAGAGLDVVSEQGPQKLLDLYRQGTDQADGLAGELERINSEYSDLVTALDMMGASAEDLATAGELYLEQLARFWDEALGGVRGIIDELTRGPSSGRAPVDLLAEQQRRVQDLAAAAAAGDLDALQQLEGESRTLLDLISQVFGSGAAGGALREELLALLQSVEAAAGAMAPADSAFADVMPASAAEIAEIFRQQGEEDRDAERVRDDERSERDDARARDLADVIRQEMREGSSRMVTAIREERVRASEDRDDTAALHAEATVSGIVSGLRAPAANRAERSAASTEAAR